MILKNILLIVLTIYFQSVLGDINNNKLGSDLRLLSFGDDQTIIDLKKVIWEPLKVTGLPSGAEIAVLRGKLDSGNSESLLRLSLGYKMPIHSHTSDEIYVWLEGAFTLIAHDGTETKFDSTAFISFPGNAPPHGLKCGLKKACILYLRLSRPFDIKYFPATRQ